MNSTRERATIGIIGGGIFGTTAALMLAEHFDVTLFDENRELLSGASHANQYRHHGGYHYPRSAETIREIQDAEADFESLYGEVIVRFPSYYAISAVDSKISAKEFLAVCDRFGLPYGRAYPSVGFLDPSTVSECVMTSEAGYDYEKLKRLIEERLAMNNRITVQLGRRVIGASINDDGTKQLRVKTDGKEENHAFTYLVNATYWQYNNFSTWLGFPKKPLELRLKELVIVRIPDHPQAAVTVMDGPFATLVPIPGTKDLYTLGDVPLSIHETRTDSDSMNPPDWKEPLSRKDEIIERCRVWFPALSDACYITSMFIVLPVEKDAEDTDARPTEVTSHGNGCWSILSGKIITAVSTAKQIVSEIQEMEKRTQT